MVVNKLRLGLKICAVKAPGFGDHRKAMLHDIAVMTGGQVITEETGSNIEDAQQVPQMLGQVCCPYMRICVYLHLYPDSSKARSPYIGSVPYVRHVQNHRDAAGA